LRYKCRAQTSIGRSKIELVDGDANIINTRQTNSGKDEEDRKGRITVDVACRNQKDSWKYTSYNTRRRNSQRT